MTTTRPNSRPAKLIGSVIALLVLAAGMPLAAQENDRHAGYYYPIPATQEVYKARTGELQGSNRTRRVLFVTELTNQMMSNSFAPPFAMFAKGADGEKMVITSLYEGGYNTLYRMRGLLAILTARARATPIFQDLDEQNTYTFLDLLKLIGFAQLTVTDGDRFAHRISIE